MGEDTNEIVTENEEIEEIENAEKIVHLIKSGLDDKQLIEELDDYHESDIADAFLELEPALRKRIYKLLGVEKVSEIFSFLEDPGDLLDELTTDQAADIIENMDADDAVDVLEDIEDEAKREEIISKMDEEAVEDVRLIASYEDDEVGSMMTTNFITISDKSSIKSAMKSLVSQAKENDNINMLYVYDDDNKYSGAIDLRDLIIARAFSPLEDVIYRNYPSFNAKEKISDIIEDLKDYAEDSFPIVNDDNEIIGIITSQDLVEAVDDEMSEDYAKLAGLTDEEDLEEKLGDSIKKRMPWLLLLLLLGMGVATVVGLFENLVAEIAIIACFQSVILGMSGNVGTQSLAVTIRMLMDEDIGAKEKWKFLWKEVKVGMTNGFIIGTAAFVFVGAYLDYFKGYAVREALEISGCIGISMLIAMTISAMVGTLIPMFFDKIKVDPAVASGPLISTLNDLVAVVTYYGLATVLLLGRI